jgi:hypothetical protein
MDVNCHCVSLRRRLLAPPPPLPQTRDATGQQNTAELAALQDEFNLIKDIMASIGA